MAEKHYIVQGAQCKCQYGSKPDELEIVQGTDREYINDSDDNQKLIASTIDLQQPFKTKTFGNCSKNNNNACVPSVTQWQDFYKNVTLTKGGHILTEDSKGTCATGTPGCITFITHGQTATVTQAHFGKVEVETLTLLNPLAPNPVPAQKELPQVKTISCKAANNDKATDTRKDKDKKVDGIKIRIDESLDFSVKSYYNEAKADTSKVSWKVVMSSSFKGETLLFESIGPAFKMNFDKPGKYRVVAFGNPAKQDDYDCAVDIEVIENTLKDGPAIAGDHTRDKGKQHLIRRGVPVTAKARFEIEPATPAEISGVSMVAKDAAGNLLASSAGTGLLLFTPANRAAQYTVTASMTSLTGTVKEVTETYTTEENVVMAITCDKTGGFFRPGTSLSFTAKTLYTGALEDFEAQQIKWQLDGKDVATGNVFTTPASLKPGDHIVEAYVSKANAALKKENDDYHFTIGDNYVESLKVIKGSNNWLLGKRYNLEVVTKMPYVPASDGNILWTDTQGKSYSGNGTGLKNAACIKTGDHTITARTYRQEKPAVLPIKCTAAGIIRWCITDEDGNFRNYAGWNETLVVHIQSATGMAGEKIHVHLLEAKDKNEGAILTESPTSYLKDLGETTFDEQGNASINFKTDDALKQQLGKKGTIGHWNSYEGNQYELMLVASPMDIVLEGMNTTMIDNNKYLSPSVATREVKREKGIFTLLDNKQDIVSIHFLRKNGKDAYSIIPYGEDIEIKVRTRNLEGTTLKLNIIWNKLAKGTEEEEQGTVVTVKNETASWTLHTGALKAKVQKAKIDLRRITLWQVEITDKDGDTFRYPDVRLQDKTLDWKKLLTYQTLKLSDNTAIGADAVKSAPVVVGEPIEENMQELHDCPNCKKDITLEEIEEIFGKSKNDVAFRNDILFYLNKYKNDFGVSSCIAKAHFVAIFKAEHQMQKIWLVEGTIPYTVKNITEDGTFGDRGINLKKRGDVEEFCKQKPQIKLFSYMYAAENGYGNGNGNEASLDGWNYRGRGIMQATGRNNYRNDALALAKSCKSNLYKTLLSEETRSGYIINYTESKKKNANSKTYQIFNFEGHPEMLEEYKYAVLSGLGDWLNKGLNGVSYMKDSDQAVKAIRTVMNSGFAAKKIVDCFHTTRLVFKVPECKNLNPSPSNPNAKVHRYEIYIATHLIKKVEEPTDSKQYEYKIFGVNNELIQTFQLTANEHGLIPFPESGPNWARFGARDKGGDNWASAMMVAKMLGLFYELPKIGYNYSLYYNDISANDGRDIGHQTHKTGQDVDIRYPGVDNSGGGKLWSESQNALGEDKFEKVMTLVFKTAGGWGMQANYAYKNFDNVKDAAHGIHKDHFHLGYR